MDGEEEGGDGEGGGGGGGVLADCKEEGFCLVSCPVCSCSGAFPSLPFPPAPLFLLHVQQTDPPRSCSFLSLPSIYRLPLFHSFHDIYSSVPPPLSLSPSLHSCQYTTLAPLQDLVLPPPPPSTRRRGDES